MDSRNLGGESRGASFRNELFERRDRKGYERYRATVRRSFSLIIIQLHSGYCPTVITVSYRAAGTRVNNCAITSFSTVSSPLGFRSTF